MKAILAVVTLLVLATTPGRAVAQDCSSPDPSWASCGCAWAQCMLGWTCTPESCDPAYVEACFDQYEQCLQGSFDCPDTVCVYLGAAAVRAAATTFNGFYFPRFDVGSSLVFELTPSVNTLRVGRMHQGAFVSGVGGVTKVDFYELPVEDLAGHTITSAPWNSLGEGTFNSTLSRWEFPYTVSPADPHVGHIFAARFFDPTAPGGAGQLSALAVGLTPSSAAVVMNVHLDPQTLLLGSRGRWVTGYLEPPSPLAASQIDVGSIRLNAVVPVDPAGPTAIGDHDGNTIPDLMVKFDRATVALTMAEGDHVPVTVTGTVNGEAFSGTDYLRVGRGAVLAPASGSHVTAGSVTRVRWETSSFFAAVALLQSLDGGATWSVIANMRPNAGSFDWAVPNVQATQAKLAVEMEGSTPVGGYIEGKVIATSEAFAIDSPVGVGNRGTAGLALRGVTPNPTRREMHVEFSLQGSQEAVLTLLDVSGRQVESRRLDGMGPGWHSVTLGADRSLPAGLYVLRLTQDGRSLTTRVALTK